MKEIEFNLLTEPWVRVRLPDNTVQEVSLTDALLHAQDYVDLAGEMPTQDAAMLRLLYSINYRDIWLKPPCLRLCKSPPALRPQRAVAQAQYRICSSCRLSIPIFPTYPFRAPRSSHSTTGNPWSLPALFLHLRCF